MPGVRGGGKKKPEVSIPVEYKKKKEEEQGVFRHLRKKEKKKGAQEPWAEKTGEDRESERTKEKKKPSSRCNGGENKKRVDARVHPREGKGGFVLEKRGSLASLQKKEASVLSKRRRRDGVWGGGGCKGEMGWRGTSAGCRREKKGPSGLACSRTNRREKRRAQDVFVCADLEEKEGWELTMLREETPLDIRKEGKGNSYL